MVLVGLVERETKVVVEDQTPLHAVVARKVAAVAVQKVHLAAATLAKKIKKIKVKTTPQDKLYNICNIKIITHLCVSYY